MKKRMPKKDSSNRNRGKKREKERICGTNRKTADFKKRSVIK